MSADFPGLPNAGHISTAFTLLAAALGTDPSLKVSLTSLMPSSLSVTLGCGRAAHAIHQRAHHISGKTALHVQMKGIGTILKLTVWLY